MAKRLSSLFTLSKDESDTNLSQRSETTTLELPKSPSSTKLHKHTGSPSDKGPHSPTSPIPPLAPPPLLTGDGIVRPASSAGSGSRPGSRMNSPDSAGSRSRPQTPNFLAPPGDNNSPLRPSTPNSAKLNKRRSWLPGKSEKHKPDDGQTAPRAWIAGLPEHVAYDLTALLQGERVPELWSENGDTFVYLYPPTSGRGASFKIDSQLILDSTPLLQLRSGNANDSSATNGPNLTPSTVQTDLSRLSMYSPSQSNRMSKNFSVPVINTPPIREEKELHLPLDFEEDLSSSSSEPGGNDVELLVLYRNFFAFLVGGALIATPRQLSLYNIFISISSILKRFDFTNVDGSTWGDVPANSFARYCDELRLADVRSSREKTIEAIVLGEHMRSWLLYNEGFVHAVGRLADIKLIRSPKWKKISPITINRLERASLDVEQRLLILRSKLEDFEFPSMFAGIANSQTSAESRYIRFKEWRLAFLDLRRFTLAYFRRRYGAWPPNAKSKKNHFEEGGLNRLLLRELYHDFTDLYDMLADRTSLTTRSVDMPILPDSLKRNTNEIIRHALRTVEGEYDRSTPPVIPPIPFDLPILPGFAQSFNRSHVASANSATSGRRLKTNEINEILLGSYNRDYIKASPFIQDFISYERRLGEGKTIAELVDLRCGQWLFMYAVLQSLPMTVVDARDVQYTEGTEYYLCTPPRGGRPWLKDDTFQSRAWQNVASGGSLISLPSDMVDHSPEGIYRRSHCWTIATKWVEEAAIAVQGNIRTTPEVLQPPSARGATSPYLSPEPSPHPSPRLSPQLLPVSPAVSEGRLSRETNRSVDNFGKEALSPPDEKTSRPSSTYNPNITFDDILGSMEQKGKKKKK